MRQTNSQEIIPGSDGDCWIFDSTQHYDDQGRKGDEEITVTPCNVVTIPPVEKNDQLDILGPDPYMAMKEFFDQLMLDKWLKKKMLGMLPGDTGTKEWSKGSLKLGVGDMLLLKAKYGEKDDTGRFVMRWVTGDGKALHTNEVWEQHWKETGYIDPMPSLVYEGRVEAIGGKCDLENRAIDLDIHTKAKKKNKNQ